MRVLIVGNEGNSQALSGLRDGGFDWAVERCRSVEERVELANPDRFDAILFDAGAHVFAAIDFIKALREAGNATPIILVSAIDDPATKACCLNAGADDFVSQPFDVREMQARLEAVTRRFRAVPMGAISVGGITVNPDSRVLLLDGKRVAMAAKELAVLELLVRNPRQTVSVERLLKHVYGIEARFRSEINIKQLVYRIRRTLERHGLLDTWISTMHGRGYALNGGERDVAAGLEPVAA